MYKELHSDCNPEYTVVHILFNMTTPNSTLNNNPDNPALIGKANDDNHDTQTFINIGETTVHEEIANNMAEDQTSVVADDVDHTIAKFCSRPYRISYDGGWPSYASGRKILGFEAVEMLRSTPIFDKLRGFYAFTATFCMRVVVNPQPTQAGALMLVFRPNERKDDAWLFWNDYIEEPEMYLPRLSGCPSTTLVAGSTSTAELKVAYRATAPLCAVDDGMFGDFEIYSLTPLVGTSNSEHCSMRVYIWLEDLKTYATAPDTVPRSPNAVYKTQGGPTKGSSRSVPSVKEAKEKVGGVVSGPASTVADIAGALTKIPIVSDIAGPVSWAADGIAGIASMFGFSKPHDVTPSMPMTINPYKDFAHGSGVVSNHTKLSFNDTQEMKVRAIGAVEEDEMSINHLVSHPIYFAQRRWQATDAYNKEVFSVIPIPQELKLTTPTTAGWTANTTLSYLAHLFKWWRGTIKITMTVVGTKFHSGRLRVMYTPKKSKTTAEDLVQHQHTYSHVIDIRDANTMTFDIPYVSIFPWRSTSRMADMLDGDKSASGLFTVYVEDELVAHPSAAQFVDIVFHVSASDFAFSGPRISQELIGNGVAVYAKTNITTPERLVFTPQGFTNDVSSDNAPACVNMVNDVSESINHLSALEQSVGDPVVSLRALAKKPALFDSADGSFAETNRLWAMCPNRLTATERIVRHPTEEPYPACHDFVEYIASLFRFRAGGMRFVITGDFCNEKEAAYSWSPMEGDLRNVFCQPSPRGKNLFAVWRAKDPHLYEDRYYNFATVPFNKSLTGALQVEIPYYNVRPFITNERPLYYPDQTYIHWYGDDIASNGDWFWIRPNKIMDKSTNITVYRSGADDFNCGFFTGPPLTFFNPTYNTQI